MLDSDSRLQVSETGERIGPLSVPMRKADLLEGRWMDGGVGVGGRGGAGMGRCVDGVVGVPVPVPVPVPVHVRACVDAWVGACAKVV